MRIKRKEKKKELEYGKILGSKIMQGIQDNDLNQIFSI
jgi:hypothetical protein